MKTMRKDLRKPGMWVLLLGSLPLVLEMLRFYQPHWSPWLGPLSILCGLTGMLMLLITFRYKLFSIVPIAKDVVFDTFQEGMLIVNDSGQVVDGNKKVINFFAKLGYSDFYGRPVTVLLEKWPEWCSLS